MSEQQFPFTAWARSYDGPECLEIVGFGPFEGYFKDQYGRAVLARYLYRDEAAAWKDFAEVIQRRQQQLESQRLTVEENLRRIRVALERLERPCPSSK